MYTLPYRYNGLLAAFTACWLTCFASTGRILMLAFLLKESACFFNPMAPHGVDLAPLQPKPTCESFCGGDLVCMRQRCPDENIIMEPENMDDADDDPPRSEWGRARI